MRDPARLDIALAELGLARSRSHAAELVARGKVRCNGDAVGKAGAKVPRGAVLEVAGAEHYVSRAAHKLLAALDAFAVDPAGLLALDLGASTGGFTQVLLERGCREVIALDVGHRQLAARLRADRRVRVVEGCNARELDAERLAEESGVREAPQLVVADLSFISLNLVLPAIARTAPRARVLLLVKPQFEVGRQGLRDGIVVDPVVAAEAATRVLATAATVGFACTGIEASPLAGEHGNRELLVDLVPVDLVPVDLVPPPTRAGVPAARTDPRRGASRSDPTEWEERIRALLGGEG